MNNMDSHYFKGAASPLSNFWRLQTPITWRGQLYWTTEGAYVYEKMTAHGVSLSQKEIQYLCNADGGKCKTFGKGFTDDNPKWDENKIGVMAEILLEKVKVEKAYKLALLDNESFVEDTADPVWGRGIDGTGQNKLGILHTRMREYLIRQTDRHLREIRFIPVVTILGSSMLRGVGHPENRGGEDRKFILPGYQSAYYVPRYENIGAKYNSEVLVMPGQTAARFKSRVLNLQKYYENSDVIVLYLGGNDIREGNAAIQVLRDLQKTTETLQKPCYVSTLLYSDGYGPDSEMGGLNRLITEYYGPSSIDIGDKMKHPIFYKDAVHLNSTGVDVLRGLINSYLNTLL